MPIARVRNVANQLDSRQHDHDHEILEQEHDAPGQVRGQESAEQRSDCRGDRSCRTDERVGLLLILSLEVAVDQGLHRGQQQRGAKPTDDRPEDDDRGQALRQRHRQRADGVAEQAEHIRPLAADEISHLAPDQDEGGRHQRLQRDRRLNAAGRRVQIVHHRRDRDVHQRRVDHEHEHRHREQNRQPSIAPGRLRRDRDRRVAALDRARCLLSHPRTPSGHPVRLGGYTRAVREQEREAPRSPT